MRAIHRREPAIIIAVLNLKGGCGKSTIAVNLACARWRAMATRSLLLDNDVQATASHWLSHGRLPVQGESMPLENDADGERLVRAVAARNERYVVIGCSRPHVEVPRYLSLLGKIADLVLVPVTASGVDLVATEMVVKLIREVRVLRRSGTPKCLIVPSKIDRRTDAGRRIDEQVQRFGEDVGPAVHQRTAFAIDAFSAGQWIGQYAPDSPAHYDITALAMAAKRSLRI